jgi:hypothetical protein
MRKLLAMVLPMAASFSAYPATVEHFSFSTGGGLVSGSGLTSCGYGERREDPHRDDQLLTRLQGLVQGFPFDSSEQAVPTARRRRR